jgi:hypothetical protein
VLYLIDLSEIVKLDMGILQLFSEAQYSKRFISFT